MEKEIRMISQVFDKIYKIELPIRIALKSMNVFFVDESPRTLIDTGLRKNSSQFHNRFSLSFVTRRLMNISTVSANFSYQPGAKNLRREIPFSAS